jgi:hypothetical protein
MRYHPCQHWSLPGPDHDQHRARRSSTGRQGFAIKIRAGPDTFAPRSARRRHGIGCVSRMDHGRGLNPTESRTASHLGRRLLLVIRRHWRPGAIVPAAVWPREPTPWPQACPRSRLGRSSCDESAEGQNMRGDHRLRRGATAAATMPGVPPCADCDPSRGVRYGTAGGG